MQKYLPAGLTQYVLNSVSKKSPPYHVNRDTVSTPLQRLKVEKITGHQKVRRRSDTVVMYETHWTGLSGPSWDREMDLQLFHHDSESATPNQPPVPPDANCCCTTGTFSEQRRAIPGARLRLRSSRRMAQSLQHHAVSQRSPPLVQSHRRFVVAWEDRRDRDYGWGIFGALLERPGADQASSYSGALHDFGRSGTKFLVSTSTLSYNSAFARGVQRNVNESRGAAVDS